MSRYRPVRQSGGGGGTPGKYKPRNPPPSAPASAPAAQPDSGDDGWLGKIASGIGDAIANVPRAVLAVAKEAPKLAFNLSPPKLWATELSLLAGQSQEDVNANPVLRNLANPKLLRSDQNPDASLMDRIDQELPVTGGIVHGVQQTGSHLNPDGGFKSLREDYGRDPVGAFLNDAANVSAVATLGGAAAAKATLAGKTAELGDAAFVAGPAGTTTAAEAASTAAKATRTASTLNRVGEVGGKVASLPFKPWEALARLPTTIGNRSLVGAMDAIEAGGNPANRHGATVKLSAPGQAVEGEILRGRSLEEMARDTNAARAKNVVGLLKTNDERVAATTVAQHEADALSLVRQHDPAGFDQYVTDRYQGTLTPKQAGLAADVVEGKAPELATKINEALAVGAEGAGGRAERQATFVAEHPDAAGYAPNPISLAKIDQKGARLVDKATLKAEALRARADKAATFDVNTVNGRAGAPTETLPISDPRTAGNLRANVDMGRLGEKARVAEKAATKAERDVTKLSTAWQNARQQAEYAIENQPSRLRPVLAENRAAQSHLTGVENDLRAQGLHEQANQVNAAVNDIPVTAQQLLDKGVDPEHFFHTSSATEAKAGRIGRNAGLPRTFKAGSERLRTGSPIYNRDVAVGQYKGETEAAVAQVRHETASRIEAVPGAVVHLGEGPLAGVTTAADAAHLGYVPWTPGALFDTLGKQTGTAETMFMPRPLFDAYRNYFEAPRGQKLGLVTDLPNRAYYLGRLALSPSYITGQIFGNATLGVMGSSNPALFFKNIVRTVSEIRKNGGVMESIRTGQGFPEQVGPRLTRSGAPAAEMGRLAKDIEGKTGKMAGASATLNNALSKPFHLAAFLDNLSRSAFYLTELEKHTPEEALRSTLRTMGEFDKMSPFERDYVRRAIPMWAWHREITKIAFHLAVDHPLRIAWVLHLGNTVGQPDGPLPDFFKDTIPFGDTLIGTGQFFPHSEIGGLGQGGYLGAGKFLGPVPRVLLGSVTGINPSTGKPFSRPYDPTNNDPAAPALWKQVANLFPQTKVVEGLTGTDQVARYSTGDPVYTKDTAGNKVTIPSGRTPIDALTNAFGVPVYDKSVAEQSAADSAKRSLPAPKKAKAAATKKSTGRYRPRGS